MTDPKATPKDEEDPLLLQIEELEKRMELVRESIDAFVRLDEEIQRKYGPNAQY